MTRLFNKTSLVESLRIFGFAAGCEITKKLIMQKYRKLVLIHHPDKGGDPKKFAKIAEAKQTLIREYEAIKNEPNSKGKLNPKFDSIFAKSIIQSIKNKGVNKGVKGSFTTYRRGKSRDKNE